MDNQNLRKAIIRLAHSKPELREDLLPLLKEARDPERLRRLRELDPEDPSAEDALGRETSRHTVVPIERLIENLRQELDKGAPIPVAKGHENGAIRVHRFKYGIKVWDLTNAGRRGKMVDHFYFPTERWGIFEVLANAYTSSLKNSNYQQALANANKIRDLMDGFSDTIRTYMTPELRRQVGSFSIPEISEYQEKGVRIDPPGKDTIEVRGRGMSGRIEYQDFFFKDLTDRHNEPAIMPRKRKRSATKKLYNWAVKNQDKLSRMTFNEVTSLLENMKIDYHYWLMTD